MVFPFHHNVVTIICSYNLRQLCHIVLLSWYLSICRCQIREWLFWRQMLLGFGVWINWRNSIVIVAEGDTTVTIVTLLGMGQL